MYLTLDSREDTHDHGTDDETGVSVLATADTETFRDDEKYRAPYSSPNLEKFGGKQQECNVREKSSNTTENMYCPNDSGCPGFIRFLKRHFG